jgi:hypothetical protein
MLTERQWLRQRQTGRVRVFAATSQAARGKHVQARSGAQSFCAIKKAAAVSRGGFRVCGGQLHKQNSRHCWRLLSEESS